MCHRQKLILLGHRLTYPPFRDRISSGEKNEDTFQTAKKQSTFDPGASLLRNCYFKELSGDSDRGILHNKAHHHTDFEIHILADGAQTYEWNDENVRLCDGDFVIFPPSVRHRSVENSENMRKYSVTFKSEVFDTNRVLCGRISDEILAAVRFVVSECASPTVFSEHLCLNRIFEMALLLFRLCGFEESPVKNLPESTDERLVLAKKYIADNIEQPISVSDISSYCYLSEKQITRLFIKNEGISPARYINRERMKKICELIREKDLSFKEISLRFGYANECYFNTAFKKHSGMSPGQYRKMYKK